MRHFENSIIWGCADSTPTSYYSSRLKCFMRSEMISSNYHFRRGFHLFYFCTRASAPTSQFSPIDPHRRSYSHKCIDYTCPTFPELTPHRPGVASVFLQLSPLNLQLTPRNRLPPPRVFGSACLQTNVVTVVSNMSYKLTNSPGT